MHTTDGPFQCFFAHYYPGADSELRGTAMIVWNAAVRDCAHQIRTKIKIEIDAAQYERAALLRDAAEELETALIVRND